MNIALILITITSLTLITVGVFLYIFIRKQKENLLTSQRRHDSIAKRLNIIDDQLEALQILIKGDLQATFKNEISDLKIRNEAALDLIIKGIDGLKKQLLEYTKELASNYENQNNQVIEEFRANLNELKNSSEQYKDELKGMHNQALKNIEKELEGILEEIKKPLDLE